MSSLKVEITLDDGQGYLTRQEKIINYPTVGDQITFSDINNDVEVIHIVVLATCNVPGCRYCRDDPILDTFLFRKHTAD